MHRDADAPGVAYAAGAGRAAALVGGAGGRATRRPSGGRALLVAAATWAVRRRHHAAPRGRGDGRAADAPATSPAARGRRDAPVRARPGAARPRGAGPRHRRVGRREHLRRRRRAAGLGRAARGARAARLPRGQHPRRDGRPPLAAVRALRLGGRPRRRRRQPAARPPHRGPRGRRSRPSSAAGPRRRCGPGAATAAATRAPTPGRSRPPSPARSGARSAGGSRTPAASRTGRCSATGRRRTVDGRRAAPPGCRSPWGWRPARSRSVRAPRWPPVRGALLVAGTTSDAGKSVLTAGLCRWLARQGVSVAPFKAQNMSLNSAVTRDGAEIGRAQAMQAAAAGVEPEAAMNPVLLKPGSDRTSQVVVLGRPYADVSAVRYREHKAALLEVVAGLPRRPAAPASTSWSARARAAPPRSTCGRPTSPTWGWPARPGCRCSSSATSTPAACSRRCSARSRCCRRRTRRWSAGSSSTSSAATWRCSSPAWRCCAG